MSTSVVLVEDLYKPLVMKREMIHVHNVRVGPSWMNPLVLFLKEDIYPKRRAKSTRYVERLLGFSYPRTRSCINAPFLDHTCSMYTLRFRNSS